MGLTNAFEEYIEYLQDIQLEDKETRFKRITKKLNKTYYESDSETDHFLLIGSLGRHTAINGVSDVDIAFILPWDIYEKYDGRSDNGQSDLLQDIKKVLKELAPRTIVRADGQVVVLEYTDYQVELLPCFENEDGSFEYPDTNDGGKWRNTNPLPEITESEIKTDETNGHFQNVCNLMRAWKNEQGFKFGGLLIDTLAYKFFNENSQYNEATFTDYPQLLKDLFNYLKGLNKDQEYWLALGSKQRVYNKDGKFVTTAKKAYNKIKDLENHSDEMHTKMIELFGKKFPSNVEENAHEEEKSLFQRFFSRNTEEFIEDMYPVDIRYSLEINCEVSQDGWRGRTPLKAMPFLKGNKSLHFFIETPFIEEPYEVRWKVRNIGEVAHQRNKIRGQIIKSSTSDKHAHEEETEFKGEHYVECYVIKNGVVVAKDRIDVPIFVNRKTEQI